MKRLAHLGTWALAPRPSIILVGIFVYGLIGVNVHLAAQQTGSPGG